MKEGGRKVRKGRGGMGKRKRRGEKQGREGESGGGQKRQVHPVDQFVQVMMAIVLSPSDFLLFWIRPIQNTPGLDSYLPAPDTTALRSQWSRGNLMTGLFLSLSGNVFTSKQLWFSTQEWRCCAPLAWNGGAPVSTLLRLQAWTHMMSFYPQDVMGKL